MNGVVAAALKSVPNDWMSIYKGYDVWVLSSHVDIARSDLASSTNMTHNLGFTGPPSFPAFHLIPGHLGY